MRDMKRYCKRDKKRVKVDKLDCIESECPQRETCNTYMSIPDRLGRKRR